MSTATLTSLAMLRVNLEERRGDYLENLRPFILQVLFTHNPNPVTDAIVAQHVREDFGLVIPRRTIQGMLRRLVSDDGVNISERLGKLQITGTLHDPGLEDKLKSVEASISSVIEGLRQYSQNTSKPISNDDEAVVVITAFLAQFDITCLSAYERGTAIPGHGYFEEKDIVLTSDYVRHLQDTDRDMFERFVVLVKGHMLANALMCPDIDNASKTYENVTFYLDTPLLVHWLGLESESEKAAARDLVDIVHELGGAFSVFTHTLDEVENVIKGAAQQLDNRDPLSPIAHEAILRRTTATALRLAASGVEDRLREGGIITELTPPYDAQFQIDEDAFGMIFDEKVRGYRSERARAYDINSVRSVYVVRGDNPARSLETSKAVLVTTNGRFAVAAWDYGRIHHSSRHVSTVIVDFSLANMAWLKTSVETTIPITQILAFSYAALRPPNELWRKYLAEIDRLQEEGVISEDEHVLVRSYELAKGELMHLTLGEDAAFKEETTFQAVDRVMKKFAKEANERLGRERGEHRATLESLESEISRTRKIKENIDSISHLVAVVFAWSISALVSVLLVCGLVANVLIIRNNLILAGVVGLSSVTLLLFTGANLVFGSSVKSMHQFVVARVSVWLFALIANRFALGADRHDSEVI